MARVALYARWAAARNEAILTCVPACPLVLALAEQVGGWRRGMGHCAARPRAAALPGARDGRMCGACVLQVLHNSSNLILDTLEGPNLCAHCTCKGAFHCPIPPAANHSISCAVHHRLLNGAQSALHAQLSHLLKSFTSCILPCVCSSPRGTPWSSTCSTRARWRRRAPSWTAPLLPTWVARACRFVFADVHFADVPIAFLDRSFAAYLGGQGVQVCFCFHCARKLRVPLRLSLLYRCRCTSRACTSYLPSPTIHTAPAGRDRALGGQGHSHSGRGGAAHGSGGGRGEPVGQVSGRLIIALCKQSTRENCSIDWEPADSLWAK